MLDASGISESMLPALLESPEISGTISKEGAAATGLLAGTPVVAEQGIRLRALWGWESCGRVR